MRHESRENKRHFPRIRHLHLVEISRFDEEGFRADLATGRTLDLSYGGLRLELSHPLPLRSVVSMTLALDEDLAKVQGQVVYLEQLDDKRCAMGVQFTKVPPRSRRLLDEFVDRAIAASGGSQPTF